MTIKSATKVTTKRARAAEPALPRTPKPDARGYYPAGESIRVMIVRDIIRRRRAANLTQAELAKRWHPGRDAKPA